jgi:D-alanyl-D-alanine carboxypeptidase
MLAIGNTNQSSGTKATATASSSTPGYTTSDVRALRKQLSTQDTEAHAIHVWDASREQTLYRENASAQVPLASITKLMTALAAAESLHDDDRVTVTLDAIRTEGYSTLRAGEQWHWHDLLDYTLVSSSNDGAEALAAAATLQQAEHASSTGHRTFTDRMNAYARKLGMHQTYFINETGLDTNESVSGAYGSAQDVSTLMAHLIETQPQLVDVTRRMHISRSSLEAYQHSATNTNKIIGSIPGLIASKTGYTDLAGGNLTVAFDLGIGHPIVVTVLGSTRDGRFADVEQIIETTRTSLVAHTY